MTSIRFSAEDFARVRFASRPAPLQELNVALSMMVRPDESLRYGRWRRRVLRTLPQATLALRDLVPGGTAPRFLDVFAETVDEGFEQMLAAPHDFVQAELARAYAASPSSPAPSPPSWLRTLHSDSDARATPAAWSVVHRAQRAAFDAIVAPVWSQVQDEHRAEFAKYAVAAAEHGVAEALTTLVPGSSIVGGDVWDLPDKRPNHAVTLAGRGLTLIPTFHWIGPPLLADDLPGRPLVVTYAAGSGLPLTAGPSHEQALASILGRSRLKILLLLERGSHTTGDLARSLGVSAATASVHAASLRAAGLVVSVRQGKYVVHQRTALGALLVHGRSATDPSTSPPDAPDPQ